MFCGVCGEAFKKRLLKKQVSEYYNFDISLCVFNKRFLSIFCPFFFMWHITQLPKDKHPIKEGQEKQYQAKQIRTIVVFLNETKITGCI